MGTKLEVGVNDLATTHPELAKEALFDPTTVVAGSNRSLRWRCKLGHEWKTSVDHRTRKGTGCPACSSNRLEPGFNDLATTHPELAKEALFDPTTVMAGTSKRLRWRCTAGHEWEAYVYSRALSGAGCAVCKGRKVLPGFNDMSITHPQFVPIADFDTTTILGTSNKVMPWKCEKGHPWTSKVTEVTAGEGKCPVCIGRRIIPGVNDLVTVRPELAPEAMFDPTTVTQFSNKVVPWKCEYGHEWEAPVVRRTKQGSGCPVCSGQKVQIGVNDLATTHPELAKEALFDPTTVVAGSNRSLRWRCKLGHEWKTSVAHRTRNGTGCPACSSHRLEPGFNDLATTHPELAKEALFDPTTVMGNTNRSMPWKCEYGHEWKTPPSNRANGSGCPVCANKRIDEGANDFATTHPELATEAITDPTTFGAGKSGLVKWRCNLGHEYSTSPNARVIRGAGCPTCGGKKVLPGFNDLATTDPELAKEALFDPTTVTRGSGRVMRWVCPVGHEYEVPVARRVSQGSGCAYCSGQKVLQGFNDFATLRPDLAEEALFDASTVTLMSGVSQRWRCPEGHEYRSAPYSRAIGRGCAKCAKYGYSPAKEGWIYLLHNDKLGLLQFGITNVPKIRLRAHKQTGWEPLDIRGPMTGDLALAWENSFKQFFNAQGIARGRDLGVKPFNGFTEAWFLDDLSVASVRELMDLVDAFESQDL